MACVEAFGWTQATMRNRHFGYDSIRFNVAARASGECDYDLCRSCNSSPVRRRTDVAAHVSSLGHGAMERVACVVWTIGQPSRVVMR